MTLRNRVIVPAMASQTASESGIATAETLDHYARLGESGASVVFVEYSFVDWGGRSEPHQLGIHSDECLPGLSKIAKVLRDSGVTPGVQITHAGGKSSTELTGGALLSPSGVRVPAVNTTFELPRAATKADILNLQKSFADAIQRAVVAGFEWVELHLAHGYGLNQWLSPHTNRRTDEYGENSEGRSRIVTEIVRTARRKHPTLQISVRFPGQDFIEGGMSREEALAIAELLKESGVDLLNVSSGLGGWRRPRDREGEGYLLPEAAFLAENQSLPVVAVGGFTTRKGILAALERVGFVAVGRRVLEDPSSFRDDVLMA